MVHQRGDSVTARRGAVERLFLAVGSPNAPIVLRTLRSVVDYRGQAVSALNRLKLRAELPVMAIWGEDDDIIPVAHALASVSPARRERAAELLTAAKIGHVSPEISVAVLRGIAGAKSAHRDLMPVWTMPGNEATTGHLTNQFYDIVAAARISVTCATYNFSPTSNMWDALKTASEEPEVVVCVYVHADKRDPAGVKAGLPRAAVYRSATLPEGQRIVSQTKFIVVDHEIILLTSATSPTAPRTATSSLAC